MIDIATSSTVHVKTWLEIIRNIHPFFSNHSKSFYLRLLLSVLFLSLISNDILAKEVELPLLAPSTLEVQQISPLNNASGIAKNVDINLTFSASIDGTTLNSTGIKIWGELNGIIDGVWSGAGSSSVTFNPTNDFLLSDVIHIEVTSNLKSTENIAATPYSAKFSVLSSKLKAIDSWEKTTFPLEIVGRAVDGPKKISFGDINKDGKLDFAVASVNDKTIRKVINTTSGSTVSFSTETIAVNSNDARGVQLVDLDKDGDLDAVYVSAADGKIEWAQNNAGIYTPIMIATNVGQFREVAVADIDGDGDNDIVTVSVGNNIVRWYQNDGNQVFTPAAISSNLSNPNSITIANLTKTGNPFIVVTSFVDDKVIAYQYKNGAFVTSTAATGIDGAIFTEVGDVNGDGTPEIVSAAFNSNRVFVHSYDSTLNKIGAGTLVATGLTEIQTVRLYDMDGDGDLDIIAAGSGNGLIEWYENDGSGNFTAVSLKIDTSGGNPVHFVVADFTGNGNPDILVANLTNDEIVLYKAVPSMIVETITPERNATQISKNASITINFNEDIKASTFTETSVRVLSQTGDKVNGTWSVLSKTASFLPSRGLPLGEVIHVELTSTIENTEGGKLNSYASSFTVEANGKEIVGQNWKLNSTVSNDLRGVTYGNGRFVAVSYEGVNQVMYSDDGEQWNAAVAAEANQWLSVTYGNGRFVAIAQNGTNRVMFSDDGITWSGALAIGDISWTSITFGNGRFVAVGDAGINNVMYSDDGENWKEATPISTSASWMSVTYGNGRFVAVAQSGTNRVMYSDDGKQWNSTFVEAEKWYSVTYGLGRFVAIAMNSQRIMYASDGINWNYNSVEESSSWTSVTYGNGHFIAVSSSGSKRVMFSTNAQVWKSALDPVVNAWFSVTYGNKKFVAVGLIGEQAAMSSNSEFLLTSSSPVGNATSVAVDSNINLIFDSTLDTTTVNTTNIVVQGQQSGPIAGKWSANSVNDNVATFDPTENLTPGEVIHVEIKSTVKSPENSQAIPKNFSFTVNASNNETLGQKWNYETAFDASSWKSITYGNNRYVAVSNSGTTRAMYSDDGKVWQAATGVEANAWESVTFGNGRFVAVTSTTETGNQVMYSDDGKVWTGAAAAIVNGWSSVTYGGGMFLAVASSVANSKVMYSDNGVNWTSGTARSGLWNAVTYGNGRFVAVSASGFMMYSSDGKSWASPSKGSPGGWRSVIYGNGGFVAVAETGQGSRIMHSTDGIEWSYSSLIDSNQWESVSYGNGTYVAVALTNKVAFSKDRNTWTYSTTNALGSWRGVTYGNGEFVAVSSTGEKRVLRTVDPFSFSSSNPTANSSNISANSNIELTFDSDVDVATLNATNSIIRGQQTGSISGEWTVTGAVATFNPSSDFADGEVIHVEISKNVRSKDGVQLDTAKAFSFTVVPANNETLGQNWVSGTAAQANNWNSITYGNGRFVAVSYSGTNRIMYSDDGANWNSVVATEANQWLSVTFGNGRYVAVSNGGTNRVMYSDDGETWLAATSAAANAWSSVTYGNGKFVAVANNGAKKIMYSNDGITWTSTTAAEENNWSSITYGNGKFVAVATTGTNRVMYSTDGISWALVKAAEDNNWSSITYGNGKFVAVANNGTNRIMYSNDGAIWTLAPVVESSQLTSVSYGNGIYVVVASDGTNKVLYSIDAVNWSVAQPSVSTAWTSVIYGEGRFVAVSKLGQVMYSEHKVDTKPTFSNSMPANNATKVAVNAPVQVKFNQPILEGTFTGITIKQGTSILSGVTASVSDSTLVLAHPDFEKGKTYVVDIPAGAVKNASNEESSALNFSFRVIQSAPVPIAFSPANGATQVPLDATLSIKFDQKLYQHPDANSLGEVNVITNGTSYGTPVSIQDSTLTINFDTSKFVAGKTVTIQISPFNVYVVNEDGLGFDAFTWTFTSQAAIPTLVSSRPANNATKVALSENLGFKFNQNITLVDASKISISGTGSPSITAVQILNDSLILEQIGLTYLTTYSVTIGAGAVKNATENLNEEVQISFTTIGMNPVIVAFYPEQGSIVDGIMGIAFSFNMAIERFSISPPDSAILRINDDEYKVGYLLKGDDQSDISSDSLVVLSIKSDYIRAGSNYEVVIPAGHFVNADGVQSLKRSWSFRFARNAPTIVSTNPIVNATKVSLTDSLIFKFDQEIFLADASKVSITSNSGSPSIAGVQVRNDSLIVGLENLENGSTYTVKLDERTVKNFPDLRGNELIQLPFRTIQSAPKPIAFSPENGANQVPLDASLSIKFDQKLYQHPDYNSLGEVIITIDGIRYGTDVSIQDSTLTINFDASKFVAGKLVTIELSPLEVYVVNEDGLGFDAFTWSFTSYVDAPTLVRSIPANDATKVEVGDDIIFRYDREFILVDQSKIIFTQGATVLQQRTDYTVDSDGNDLVITLEDDLDYFTTYSISVGAGAIRDNNDLFNVGEQVSFRTEIGRPRSLSYFPEQNATQVPLNAAIGIKFDKPIFKSSLSDSVKAKVTIEGNDYSFDVTLKDSTATVDFDTNLFVAGKQVTVELSKEVGTWIVNEEDVVIQSQIWSFTSVSSIPTVLSTSPVNNATKVSLSDSLVFTFDQNITLENGFLVTISDGLNSLAPSFIRVVDNKLIVGTDGFTNGTTYTVTIGAGAVKNAQNLSNTEAVLSFRTIQSAPKPIAFSPANGASQVPLDASLSIKFDQKLYQHPDANSLGEVNVSTNGITYGTPVSIQDSTLTINFDVSKFVAGKTVSIQISPFDLRMVNEDGLGFDAFTWSFTSTSPAPVLVQTSPANNATKVAINAPVRVKFNQPILEGTFTGITIKQESITLSGVTASVSDSSLILAHPDFENGKTYVVDVLEGAVKNASNQESSAVNFSFRTIQSAPKPIAFSPANGANQVPLDATLRIKFDQKLYQHPDANSLGEVSVSTDGITYGTPVSIQDSTLTINFDASKFVEGKSVSIQISPFDLRMVNEDGLGFDAFTWSFTSFKPNPVLVSSSPLDNATKVSLSDSLVFMFDQNITLENASLVTISDGINSFTPSFVRVVEDKLIVGSNGFTNGTTYIVRVDSGAVVNEFNLANSKTEITFRTIMSAPVVSSFLPLANQQRVALGSPIHVSLTQSVKVTDALEVNLTPEGGASISGVRASLTDTLLTLSGFTLENATNYTVEVKSGSLINEDSVANASIAWNFRTIMAAPVVTEVSPVNGSVDISTTGTAVVRFSQEITIADASKVSFSPATTNLTLSTSGDSLVIAYTNLQAITTYTVTVESGAIVNADEVSNATNSWSFTTLIAPPAAPELVSPDSAAINQAITALGFTWNAPQYAETYQFQLSDVEDFSSLIEDATDLSVTNFTPTMSLEYFRTHFWRVKAFNNAGESDWSVVYRLTTVPAAPSQVFPQMAQTEISTAPLIKWNSAHADVRFNLVVASDTSLTTVLKDTLLNQSEYQFFGLSADTKYFWSVRVSDVRGTSAWSDTRVFLTRQDPVVTEDKDVDVTFDFGTTSGSTTSGGTPTEKTKPQQTDYRMVSLPGTDGIRVDAFFKTEYKKTWRAFIETGDPLNFYDEYTPEDNRFVFTPGLGFWVLSTEIVADVRKFTPVNTNTNDSYAIPVHAGWNIIGNPYQSNVDWKLTLAFNTKQSGKTISGDLWGYEKAFVKTDTLKPLKGYYFYNDPTWNLTTLYLPYTGFDQRGQDEQLAKEIPAETPVLTATATYEDGTSLDVNWVFAKSSALEMDIMRRHPSLDFVQQGMILTDKNDKSVGYVRQESELIEDGTAYELELKARRGSTVLWKSIMQNLPMGTKLLLINQVTKLTYMVGSEEEIKLKITEPKTLFDVYIGSEEYLQEVKESLLPGEFTLMQNYPNPFNPTTVIRYGLKEAGMVKLEIFDILGRKVQTLVNKNMQPGWYIADFNAVNLSSGVYLYRLQSGNQVKVHKMVLVK